MDIEVLEVLPGNQAVVSTEGLVRLTRDGKVLDEFLSRREAEHLVEYFADAPRLGTFGIAEYEPVPVTMGGA